MKKDALSRFDDAEAYLRKVLEQRPTHRRAHYLLGQLYSLQGKFGTARTYLLRFSELEKEAKEDQAEFDGEESHTDPFSGLPLNPQ